MTEFLANRPRSRGPLFCHFDGSPLTQYQFNAMFRKVLSFIDCAESHYSAHSFRIGAATTAAELGVQRTDIQEMGRWRSQAVSSYIRPAVACQMPNVWPIGRQPWLFIFYFWFYRHGVGHRRFTCSASWSLVVLSHTSPLARNRRSGAYGYTQTIVSHGGSGTRPKVDYSPRRYKWFVKGRFLCFSCSGTSVHARVRTAFSIRSDRVVRHSPPRLLFRHPVPGACRSEAALDQQMVSVCREQVWHHHSCTSTILLWSIPPLRLRWRTFIRCWKSAFQREHPGLHSVSRGGLVIQRLSLCWGA